MLTSKDKGIKPKNLNSPPEDVSNLYKHLPGYLSYRAALLREKLSVVRICWVLVTLLIASFLQGRWEVHSLQQHLRTKEYILAPGVKNYTTVAPQSVPDDYVSDAAQDFISTLGNINSRNIQQQYAALSKFMSDPLQIRFAAETREWLDQVKAEDLAQIVTVDRTEILSDEAGHYKVTAYVRADFYISGQYLGKENQVIELEMQLVPPDQKRRWYLQMTSLNWSKLDAFKKKQILTPKTKDKP